MQVEPLILNPHFSLTGMLLVNVCLYNHEYISFYKILESGVKREIGLKLTDLNWIVLYISFSSGHFKGSFYLVVYIHVFFV
jgi:hypothetical protein